MESNIFLTKMNIQNIKMIVIWSSGVWWQW